MSRKKGWKVLVLKDAERDIWWLTTLYDRKKRAQEPMMRRRPRRGLKGIEPPLRGKPAYQLTEQEAKRAFADAKKTGNPVRLVNPRGVTVRSANR